MIKPYYKDDWVKIYNTDSQNMSFIPDKSVHLVITSPPYNVGIKYDGQDDRKQLDNYFKMLENVFRECYRVLVSGGRICLNCPSVIRQTTISKMAFVSIEFHNILKNKIGFIPREFIGWVKTPVMQQEDYDKIYRHQGWGKSTSWGSWKSPSNPSLRDIMEYIIVMDKENPKLEGDKEKIDITKEEFMKYTNNCWFILPTTKNKSGHPASFPEELPYRLIKLYSYSQNVILDPFLGSGTTCKVAKRLKRKSIGVDISLKYCKIAMQKCSQSYFDFRLI